MILFEVPSDYWKAFRQMIYALKYIRGDIPGFETGLYDENAVQKAGGLS